MVKHRHSESVREWYKYIYLNNMKFHLGRVFKFNVWLRNFMSPLEVGILDIVYIAADWAEALDE